MPLWALGYPGTRQVYPKGLSSGSISYTYNSKTLTLDGITMKCSDRFINNKNLDDLKIVVKGTNNVDGGGEWCIFSLKDLFIEGYSSSNSDNNLKIWNSFGSLCLWLNDKNGTMTLKNLTLDVKGSDVGIYCAPAKNIEGTLTIDNCKISSKVKDSEKYSAIHGFKACNFKGCGVNTRETPAYYSKELCGFKYDNGTLASTLSIDLITTTYDGITILGTPVTNLNVRDVVVEGKTFGVISYDSSTKVLQLNNVRLTAPEGNMSSGLRVSSDAVSSIFVKNEAIITTEGHVIQTSGSGTITLEGGFFTGTSTKESGLSMDGKGGFVFNVSGIVDLVGQKKGIWGNGTIYNSSIVTMKNNSSYYRFKGIEDGAIINVADVKREGMDYCFNFLDLTPGCYFDDGCVRKIGGKIVKGNDVVGFAEVKETYGITVAGTPINDCNRNGVGSKYITGESPLSVIYIPKDKILLLYATIEYNGDDKNFVALKNDGVDGLNILLTGDNTINTSGYIALELGNSTSDKPVTTKIIGDGKLYAKSSLWYGIKIGSFNTLDIGENVEIKAEGLSSGISNNMDGSLGETLIIRDNAHVEAKGNGSVQRLNAIQLEDGIKILEPTGAEIKKDNDYGWGVFVGDQLASDWVVFGAGIKGDVNGDGSVDVADIATVIDVMASAGTDSVQAKAADVNGDGSVDVADIATIIDIMAAN